MTGPPCSAACQRIDRRARPPAIACRRYASACLRSGPPTITASCTACTSPRTRARRARISVWMRTARKRQVVAFKSFLRTVVPRGLPSPRLRAVRARRDVPHRGLLQARVEPCQRAARERAPRWRRKRLTREIRRCRGVAGARALRPARRVHFATMPSSTPRGALQPGLPCRARLGVGIRRPFATALVEPRLSGGQRVAARLAIPPDSRPLPTE